MVERFFVLNPVHIPLLSSKTNFSPCMLVRSLTANFSFSCFPKRCRGELSVDILANTCFCHFQAKKDVAQIFNNILRRQIGTRTPTVEYICTKKDILKKLVKGLA